MTGGSCAFRPRACTSRPLDLSKPLWEFTVIEGLDNIPGLPKDCYAIVSKVHHACVDGVSGVDMTEAIHDLDPNNPHIRPNTTPWRGEEEPNPLELLARASINNALQPFRFAEVLARTVPAMGRVGRASHNAASTRRSPYRARASTEPCPHIAPSRVAASI